MAKSTKVYWRQAEYYFLWSGLLFSLVFHLLWWHFPLVRDEGEFAVIARQILDGIPLYQGAYNYKLPGVSLILALNMLVFGKSVWTVRFTGMLINLLSIWMVYKFSKRFLNRRIAFYSAFFYSLLSNHFAMVGYATMSEQFVALFIVSGLYFLLSKGKKLHLFISGLMFGLALLMKQSILFMLLAPFVYLSVQEFPRSALQAKKFLADSLRIGCGITIPYLLVVTGVYLQGSFTDLWKWTVVFPSEYSAIIPLRYGWIYLKSALKYISYPYRALWLAGLLGFLLFLWQWKSLRQKCIFTIWGLLAFAGVSAGFYYRFHYFYFVLPFPAIMAAFFLHFMLDRPAASEGGKSPQKAVSYRNLLTFLILIGLFLYAGKYEFLMPYRFDSRQIVRRVEGRNPYYEMPLIAQKVKPLLKPEDQVLVFGSEAEFYFYVPQKNATGYLFTYEMVKPHPGNLVMQKEYISQAEQHKPKIFLDVDVRTSWLKWDKVPDTIFRWKEVFLKNYRLAGLVEYDMDTTLFLWDVSGDYQPVRENVVRIYSRLEHSQGN